MANKLMGMKNGKPLPDPNKQPPPFKVFLYHESHEAKIFTSQEDVDAAMKDGWVDTPAKLKKKDVETGLKPVSAEISVLQKQIEVLKDELSESFEAFAEQAQQLEIAEKTIADLKNTNADLEKQNTEHEKMNMDLENLKLDLEGQISGKKGKK